MSAGKWDIEVLFVLFCFLFFCAKICVSKMVGFLIKCGAVGCLSELGPSD